MRRGLFVFLGLVPFWVMAEAEESPAPNKGVVDGYVASTDLGKNLQAVEDYYQEINRQLDKQMNARARDPFEKLVDSESSEANAKPRFIPRKLNSTTTGGNEAANGVSKPNMKRARANLGSLPTMQFRGFLKSNGDKAGLLEISEQGTFVVHEGDQVGLSQSNGEMVVRVVEINELNLIVEFGSIGTKVVVQ